MKYAFVASPALGNDLDSQCAVIRRAGCEGVEALLLPDMPMDRWQTVLGRAAAGQGLAVAAVIIGGLALNQPGQDAYVEEAMCAAHALGAGVLVTPEYRPVDPLPLQPPYAEPPEAEKAQVDRALAAISATASRLGQRVFFEPITQFQSRFWRDTQSVLAACKRLKNPLVGLALDFWVMNITEASIAQTIRAVGQLTYHVHLADNNRLLPGQGQIDFAAGLQALDEIGYRDWYSFECAVLGDVTERVAACIQWLRAGAQG